ncbi:hypothetical protein [Hyphomicrobium sp.]|uniref:hypothetical protein n=1 Tax=Hyphomicrobium sp. TaxID=82 RepID=UPI0025BF03C6|nr:hypothetical protein [Hyphomicrobium sp.]MCC7254185.1 hypothetical protein [Hyphomicrobium sp.]
MSKAWKGALAALAMVAVSAPALASEGELSPREAKERIASDVEAHRRRLSDAKAKLEALIAERDSPNVKQRLDELEETLAKAAAGTLKDAVEQFKDGPVVGAKKTANAIERAKDLVDRYDQVVGASGKVAEAQWPKIGIDDDIRRQEAKVGKAAIALKRAEFAANAVVPFLDALEEQRVQRLKNERAAAHQKDTAAVQRKFDSLPKRYPTPGAAYDSGGNYPSRGGGGAGSYAGNSGGGASGSAGSCGTQFCAEYYYKR